MTNKTNESKDNNKHNSSEETELVQEDKEAEEEKPKSIVEMLQKNKKVVKIMDELNKELKEINLLEILENYEKLQIEIADLKKEKNEYLTTLQRFKADFENYKKRIQKQDESNKIYYAEKIISKLFEPFEDFSRVIDFAKEKNQETVPLEGVLIIHDKIKRLLEDEGVELITPKKGEEFNPNFHEAICLDETGKYEPNTIVQNFEKGYRIKTRVVRAAKVMVAAENQIEEETNKENEKS